MCGQKSGTAHGRPRRNAINGSRHCGFGTCLRQLPRGCLLCGLGSIEGSMQSAGLSNERLGEAGALIHASQERTCFTHRTNSCFMSVRLSLVDKSMRNEMDIFLSVLGVQLMLRRLPTFLQCLVRGREGLAGHSGAESSMGAILNQAGVEECTKWAAGFNEVGDTPRLAA
eukprot:2553626-Amphidinium_carterae.1